MRSSIVRLVLVLLLLAPVPARAGACGASVYVYAASPELARDGLVVLDAGYRGSDFAAATLAFVTPTETSPARVVRTIGDSEGYHVQFVLAPTTTLPARTTVHLATGDSELDKMLVDRTLTTSDATDGRAVRWSSAPAVLGHRIVPSNKGDSLDAYRIRVRLDAPAFAIATFKIKNETQVALYPISNGETLVGLVGCSSMWTFHSGTSVVTLTALGPDGREVAAPGKGQRLSFR